LRRTTSALTPTVLGVALTASTALAQQMLPSGEPPQGTSSARGTTPNAGTAPLYGMTSARSARYLLRNGLDYLNYQQYERALKFLREAEASQKQLTEPEKLELKKGIERAQRELREASDAESPYALSDRAHPHNGFTAAKPSAETASRSAQPELLHAKASQPIQTNRLATQGEEEGEPIRLASGEQPAAELPPSSLGDPTPSTPDAAGSLTRRRPSGARASLTMPEQPQIPKLSELTNVPTMPDQNVPAGYRGPAIAGGLLAQPGTVQPQMSLQPAKGQAAPDHSSVQPEAKQMGSSLLSPSTLPPLSPAPDLSQSQDQDPPSPTVEIVPDRSQSIRVPTADAGTLKTVAQDPANAQNPAMLTPSPVQGALPTSTGLNPPAEPSRASDTGPNRAVVNLETIPQSIPTRDVQKADHLDASAHKETEAPSAPPVPDSTAVVQQVTASSPAQQPSTPFDELPPLPSDLSSSKPLKPVPPVGSSEGRSVPPPQAAEVTHMEDLPPLPSDPGRPATPDNAVQNQTAQSYDARTEAPNSLNPVDLPPLPAQPPAPAGVSTGISSSTPLAPIASTGAITGAIGSAHTEAEDTVPSPDGNARAVASSGDQATNSASTAAEPQLPGPPSSSERSTTDATLNITAPKSSASSAELLSPKLTATVETAALPVPADAPLPAPVSEDGSESTSGPALGTMPPVSQQPSPSTPAPSDADLDVIPRRRESAPSTLGPELQREVERIARMQEQELRQRAQSPPSQGPRSSDTSTSDLRTQTNLDIIRAPSPAEARPIKAIPVPEDWVPLGPRNWSPQRKYWAAAATCHLPLYFQDPVLERYGHSVEQFAGPLGRFLSYPVDDPTQSIQRNQILQPFFSWGLFCLQIAAWPYNLIMDPPWEAQYDLGYYRPGDNIPTDLYWLPLHGYGPPLRGNNY
jgi:hypothetical protein